MCITGCNSFIFYKNNERLDDEDIDNIVKEFELYTLSEYKINNLIEELSKIYKSFGYNNIEWFCRSDCYVITAKSNDIPLKALLGILNSKLYYLWLFYKGKRKG